MYQNFDTFVNSKKNEGTTTNFQAPSNMGKNDEQEKGIANRLFREGTLGGLGTFG